MGTLIENTQRKTLQYWYEDGLTEIGMGGVFFIMGCLNFLALFFFLPIRAILSGALMPFVLLSLFFLSNIFVHYAKQRITYPRTGYIAYRKDKTQKRSTRKLIIVLTAMVVAIVTNLILGYLLFSGVLEERWLTALIGLMAAIVLAMINLPVQLPRFYILTGWIILSGLMVSWLNPGQDIANPAFLLLVGVGCLASGSITLLIYLKIHPMSQDVEAL